MNYTIEKYALNYLPKELIVQTKQRSRYGLEHTKQIKRLVGMKKPIGDFSKGDLWLRDFDFMSLLRRCQSLENGRGDFEYDLPIYEVLEVQTTGEIFRSYFEVHFLPPNGSQEYTSNGVKRRAF